MSLNENKIAKIDSDNMRAQIISLYSQISDSYNIMNSFIVR